MMSAYVKTNLKAREIEDLMAHLTNVYKKYLQILT